MNRKNKILVSVVGITIVLIALLGLTYGYYLTRIQGNTNVNSISVASKKLELVYRDNSEEIIKGDGVLIPTIGTSIDDAIGTKNFTVTNNGSATAYEVIIDNVNITTTDGIDTEFASNDFRYTLTCSVKDKNGNVLSEETCNDVKKLSVFPIDGGTLVENQIEENKVHEYTLILWYIDNGTDQSVDMGKKLQARVNIKETELITIYSDSNAMNYTMLPLIEESEVFTNAYKTSVTIQNLSENNIQYITLKMENMKISEELLNKSFKLAIYENESQLTKYNFENTEGEDLNLLSNITLKPLQTKTYDIYMYILENESDQTFMLNKNFSATLNVEASYNETELYIKSINHRGYNLIAPSNTLSAFRLSKEYGFDYVETDVRFTSDGVPVLLHDETIDNTSNGTGKIAEISYKEVLQYDFGSWKSINYTGEKIPTFEEFIALCKELNLKPYIEVYASVINDDTAQTLVNIVEKYDMLENVTWISFAGPSLDIIAKYHLTGRFGVLLSNDNADTIVNYTLKRKTAQNSVFVDLSYAKLTNEIIEACKQANLPLEIYDGRVLTAEDIKSLNPYISGITHDIINVKSI